MIGNIIAYTISVIFSVVGMIAIIAYTFNKAPDRSDGFWGGIVFLAIGLFFAWMWGI